MLRCLENYENLWGQICTVRLVGLKDLTLQLRKKKNTRASMTESLILSFSNLECIRSPRGLIICRFSGSIVEII